MVPHHGLDRLSRLVRMVEGDGADVVVEHVRLDDAVEELAANEAEFAVDGCGRAARVGPGCGGVVREGRVGVLEEGDHYEPVVDPQIWKTVPEEQVRPAEVRANLIQSCSGDQKTKVAQQDQFRVLRLIQRAAGVEMVHTSEQTILLALSTSLLLGLMLIVTSGVGEEVHGPAEKLLADDPARSGDWCLFSQLVQLMHEVAVSRGEDLPRLRDENHIAGEISSRLVVLAVGDLPREIRDQ